VSRGYKGDWSVSPKGRKSHQPRDIVHSTTIPFFFKNTKKLLLKRPYLVMLLALKCRPDRIGTSLAHGERAVAGLPGKKMAFGPKPVYPPRRIRFYQMSDIGDGVVGGHTNQEMHVIASAIDAESSASD